jgi:UDP-N-acetyl-D-mannosaminuronic acid dehydrogenase
MIVRKKIIVIGTGYVGLPAALMWAKAGMSVVGVDIKENVVRAINERTMLLNEQELQSLLHDPDVEKNLTAQHQPTEGDVFVIAVPTPVDGLKKVCDISAVEAAIQSIAPFLQPGNLVILESTVPPMTCRRIIQPLIEKLTKWKVPDDILLAHCPERILPGDVFQEIVHNDRLLGGIDSRSADAAAEVYSAFVRGELHRTDDVTAELSKLMENTYRDVNIALANEFAQICEPLGVDPREAIAFANKHPRVKILNPGIGVGGHCIPVDPWFLKEVAPYTSRLITMARLINDEMPQRVAEKIRRAVKDVDDPKIVAFGATYKRNSEDVRDSPALKIVQILRDDGYHVDHYDAYVPELRCASVEAATKGADHVAVLVCHDQVKNALTAKRSEIEKGMRSGQIVFYDR